MCLTQQWAKSKIVVSLDKEFKIMAGLGMPELLIIALIILILFGARRIPELAKGLGEGIRNFKTGMHSDETPKLETRKEERKEESV
jgi:sec-independent protein translocase protein TatA